MQSPAPLARAAALTGVLALSLALFASAADGASIYTCVNKHSGSARFVGSKTKCRRSERRVSWNTMGPAGPAGPSGASGAPGAPGAAGASGVGADYAASTLGPSVLAASETGNVVVSKTIPAGSYFVSAKTMIAGTEATSAVFVVAACELLDTTGTPVFVEESKALDLGEWVSQLSKSSLTEYEGLSTLAMQAQLTTTVPTTVALVCAPIEGTKEAKIEAFASAISALQTTANR